MSKVLSAVSEFLNASEMSLFTETYNLKYKEYNNISHCLMK